MNQVLDLSESFDHSITELLVLTMFYLINPWSSVFIVDCGMRFCHQQLYRNEIRCEAEDGNH